MMSDVLTPERTRINPVAEGTPSPQEPMAIFASRIMAPLR
jgi:hypothetical protein